MDPSVGRAPTRRRARYVAPLWVLLLLLALVPTTGMAGFAAFVAAEKADAAGEAARVAGATADLVELFELNIALANEQVPTQAMLRVSSYDISVEDASELIGFDIQGRYAAARKATDAALEALPADGARPAVARIRAELPAIRRMADSPGADPEEIHAAFQRVLNAAEQATTEEAAELSAAGPALVDRRVADSLEGLAAVVSTFQGFQQQTVAMGNVLLSFRNLDEERVAVTLAFGRAQYQSGVDQLVRQPDPMVRRGWREIAAHPEVKRHEAAVEASLADPSWLTTGGFDRIAEVFAAAIVQTDLLAELGRTAGERGVALALEAERSARHVYRRTISLSLLMGAGALAVTFLVSRSVSRPLRLLALRASGVTSGHLVAPQVPEGGPREVRTVARALDEAASTLRRIEAQAKALAAGSLDDVVLATAVPGMLGESVHASVAQLSSSLRGQEELRRRLLDQAHHDALTGLPNRIGFLDVADKALARARRAEQPVALLLVDLDGFKRANDVHGHEFGDQVLVTVGERLVATARAGDTVARLGGDEFVVIAEQVESFDRVVALGERLVAGLSEPVVIDGRSARIGASIGLAVSRSGLEGALGLLAEADQAVDRAKRNGGGRIEVFDEALRRELSSRHEIEEALRAGIPRGELELHYQPVVDASTGSLQGFEALVRWERPGHGLVPPMDFIPIAEASDLVDDLGRWVLGEATDQLVAWSAVPELAEVHVSVNISGRHLLDVAVVDDVRRVLERSGLAPERLVLEITETVLLADLGVAVDHLRSLREMGVRIALDDFGTGYTSIGQLGALPIDILKIDRAFVSELHHRSDRSLVELMVGVAHTLGLGLVAEGVEDHDQLSVLRRLACDDVQGYLIARPLRAADAPAWAAHPGDDPGGVRTARARVGSSETVS